jgi:hypothetical protein
MDKLEFEFLCKTSKENKRHSKYLREYAKLDSVEKKESRKQNKEFWDDFLNETPLPEDIVLRKFNDLQNCINFPEW